MLQGTPQGTVQQTCSLRMVSPLLKALVPKDAKTRVPSDTIPAPNLTFTRYIFSRNTLILESRISCTTKCAGKATQKDMT
jgi:hypothetical protein